MPTTCTLSRSGANSGPALETKSFREGDGIFVAITRVLPPLRVKAGSTSSAGCRLDRCRRINPSSLRPRTSAKKPDSGNKHYIPIKRTQHRRPLRRNKSCNSSLSENWSRDSADNPVPLADAADVSHRSSFRLISGSRHCEKLKIKIISFIYFLSRFYRFRRKYSGGGGSKRRGCCRSAMTGTANAGAVADFRREMSVKLRKSSAPGSATQRCPSLFLISRGFAQLIYFRGRSPR